MAHPHCTAVPGDSDPVGTTCVVFTNVITNYGGNSVNLYRGLRTTFPHLSPSHSLFLLTPSDVAKHILEESKGEHLHGTP